MNSGARDLYLFVCPECVETLEVDRSMRDALIRNGCVICGAEVTAAAFTRQESTDTA